MANLKINTDAVVAAAGNTKLFNTQIRDGFPNVLTAITQLDNAWAGMAAAHTLEAFSEIKAKYPDARYNVLDNYANFLLQQVGEGYVQTEEANISLADAFK